jgi:hypothetical protein
MPCVQCGVPTGSEGSSSTQRVCTGTVGTEGAACRQLRSNFAPPVFCCREAEMRNSVLAQVLDQSARARCKHLRFPLSYFCLGQWEGEARTLLSRWSVCLT